MVSHGSSFTIQLCKSGLEPLECSRIVKFSLDEANSLSKLLPDILIEGGTSVLLHRIMNNFFEVLVFPVSASKTYKREARRKQPPVGEVVDRRHQLLARQISSYAKNDQSARTRNAIEPAV